MQDFPHFALAKLYVGTVLLMIGLCIEPLWSLLGMGSYQLGLNLPARAELRLAIPYLTLLCTVIGAWLYAAKAVERIPGTPIAGPPIARTLVRLAAVAVLLDSGWNVVLANAGRDGFPFSQWIMSTIRYRWMISAIISIALFASLMLYTRWLAWRIPDRQLARRALLCTWLFPVVMLADALIYALLGSFHPFSILSLPDWLAHMAIPLAAGLTLNTMRRRLAAAITQVGAKPIEEARARLRRFGNWCKGQIEM